MATTTKTNGKKLRTQSEDIRRTRMETAVGNEITIHTGRTLLQRLNVSLLGAQEFLAGQPVTSPQDRQRLAEILLEMLG